MDIKGILSISGFPGLFKLITQTKNGIIVESLIDKKRRQAFATSKISSLEDIAIYSEAEDVPLSEVFTNIFKKENGGPAIDSKASSEEMKRYFNEVFPSYDKERVYVSDIKRVLAWYNLLIEHNMLSLDEPKEEENQVEEVKETEEVS